MTFPRSRSFRYSLVMVSLLLCARIEAVDWARILGGTDLDVPWSIDLTPDGGVIVAGFTASYGMGSDDGIVAKFNSKGQRIWSKTYGGTDDEELSCIVQRRDGGYFVSGYTDSFGAGWNDAWLLRINASSRIVWQKTYGGWGGDYVFLIRETRDGGVIMVGQTYTYGAGNWDILLMKTSTSGNLQWARTFGGTEEDRAFSVELTPDGGYVVAGWTYSFGAGQADFWVLKLDAAGGIQWQRVYGGKKDDWAFSIKPTMDGGYVVVGNTDRFTGPKGHGRAWVLKLSSAGAIQWQKVYRGKANFEELRNVWQVSDGNFIVAGRISNRPSVLKLSPNGSIIWQRQYHEIHTIEDLVPDDTGGYFAAGQRWYSDFGKEDIAILKLDPDGKLDCSEWFQDGDAVSISTKAWTAKTACTVTFPSIVITRTTVGNINAEPQVLNACN